MLPNGNRRVLCHLSAPFSVTFRMGSCQFLLRHVVLGNEYSLDNQTSLLVTYLSAVSFQ